MGKSNIMQESKKIIDLIMAGNPSFIELGVQLYNSLHNTEIKDNFIIHEAKLLPFKLVELSGTMDYDQNEEIITLTLRAETIPSAKISFVHNGELYKDFKLTELQPILQSIGCSFLLDTVKVKEIEAKYISIKPLR